MKVEPDRHDYSPSLTSISMLCPKSTDGVFHLAQPLASLVAADRLLDISLGWPVSRQRCRTGGQWGQTRIGAPLESFWMRWRNPTKESAFVIIVLAPYGCCRSLAGTPSSILMYSYQRPTRTVP